ncbi:MAG: Rieske 2Fe-2S domain-containing protein [Sporocytophaga sp.]|uniref:Rieske 2Fe-2S domain-containing protein n=1 Tax=Sporocytophaga sp. TaxID=2231183 RepID=UPI001B1A1CF9|nr:Rieske 2Fe-2S domain-containing protein [Sporocytophaga sp.]MBO9699583.1 Rieske 2Fe-2S domain-containing protein [Sporocytophaga sp.]
MKKHNCEESDILRFPHPVLVSSSLKKKIKEVTINGKKYVLYRDNNGKPVAFPIACPHRGALLSKGKINKEGELVCAYHAWKINASGQAQSPSVSNKTCEVHSLKTWDKYGFIWIANKNTPDEAFPDFIKPGYDLIDNFSSHFDAPVKVALDNFGEIEHAFKVHTFIGPGLNDLNTVDFKVKIEEEQTYGFLDCKYRNLPLFLSSFFGIKKGDHYHNDWVFKFKPLHGSYKNYWTDKDSTTERAVSFIITSFLVPVNSNETKIQVFVQMAIKNKWLKLLTPILKLSTILITRYEIWADAGIAQYAAEDPEDGSNWKLTYLDKQIMPNRKLMDKLYFQIQDKKVLTEEEIEQ